MSRHVVGDPDPKITPLTQRGFIFGPVLHHIASLGDLVTAGNVELMWHEQAISEGESKFESLYAL